MKKRFERIRSNKSYFSKLLKYFLMAFCVPVLTIVLLNVSTQSVVRRQILLSNQSILTQFFELIDATAEEMKEVCIDLAYNAQCQNYANSNVFQSGRAPYLRYEIKQMMGNLYRKGCKDVFLYFPEDDRIISGENSSLISERYYKAYYEEKEYHFMDEFYEILNCESQQPVFCVMNSKSDKPYLCVAMKRNGTISGRKDYVVVVVLDPEYLSQILFRNESEQGGNIIMFDGEGKMLLNANADELSFDLDEFPQNKEYYETEIGGKKYVMQVQESQVLKGYYASVIPSGYFWRQLFGLQLLSVTGIIACIILGGIIVYKGSRKSYEPIEEVMNRLQVKSKVKYDMQLNTEFDFILSVFQKESEEKQQLYRRIKVREGSEKEQRLEHFLISLLEGKVRGDTAGNDIFVKNGMVLYSDKFFLGILKMDIRDELEWEMKSFVVKNVFKELCDRYHKGYIVPSSDDCYIIIMNLKMAEDEENLSAILAEGKEFLEQHYEMKVTIGMSRIHEGMTAFQVAYNEAKQALKYQFIFGKGTMITYREVMERKFFSSFLEENQLYQKMEDFIKGKGKEKNPVSFVSKLLDLYGIDDNISLETMECFKFDILSTVNKLMISNNFTTSVRQSMIEKLLSQETLEDFQNCLLQLVTDLYHREQENVKQRDVCSQVKKYIDENYMDSQLSVSVLGEELKISSSYLSKLFKEKYEISVLDYIASVRISHAKEMLRRKDLSLNEVARQNGFLSSNVFIKTFKKCEGITPGRYREFLF